MNITSNIMNFQIYILGPWISSRCFLKDDISSTPCMEFRMVTHRQGSTVCNLKFQCMVVHYSVNHVFVYWFWKCLLLCQIKCFCGEFYCTTLFKRNLQLKHTEFLLRLTATMLCRIRHAETGFDASKIMILNLRIRNVLAHRQSFKDEELKELLDQDSCQTLAEFGKILQVDASTVSKRLKALGMIQKQGHWVPYELKPRDVERRFLMCELLLQRQKRKGFLHRIVTGDEKWIHYDNQNQISMVRSFFSAFGGISRV